MLEDLITDLGGYFDGICTIDDYNCVKTKFPDNWVVFGKKKTTDDDYEITCGQIVENKITKWCFAAKKDIKLSEILKYIINSVVIKNVEIEDKRKLYATYEKLFGEKLSELGRLIDVNNLAELNNLNVVIDFNFSANAKNDSVLNTNNPKNVVSPPIDKNKETTKKKIISKNDKNS